MFVPFLVSTRAFFCYRRQCLLGLAYTPAFLSARSSLWQMHCPPFYSKQLTSESPVNTRPNTATREGLHCVAIEKSAGPFGAPWDILDLCIVPADMTRSSDMSLESHQEHSRAPQIVSDASVWATESSPKTRVLPTANKYILILKWWPNLESDLRKKPTTLYVSWLSHVTSSWKSWLLWRFLLDWGDCFTTATGA